MSSEALDKTIITDSSQIFSKQLFQHFIHHKNFNLKLFAVQEFLTKIYPCGRLYHHPTPPPPSGANRVKEWSSITSINNARLLTIKQQLKPTYKITSKSKLV